MTRFVIDGPKVILNKADVENKVDSVDFEVNEVYAIDIVREVLQWLFYSQQWACCCD